MKDRFQRDIDYLRISITDRCNLRCCYCMPHGICRVAMEELLTYEEIFAAARAAVACGITKFRITGGEPLVRKGAADLIGMLKGLPGVSQVALTTNGVLFAKHADALKRAGLDAVNVSLNSLRVDRYAAITGFPGLPLVLDGIDAALRVKLQVKVNTVLLEGVNADEWEAIAQLAKDRPIDVRFIELMPIGAGKDFAGVGNTRLYDALKANHPGLREDSSVHGNGPAVYVRLPDFRGSIGFISAMHGRFCAACNRMRLTSTGRLKPCLCYGETIDLREILRCGESEAATDARLRAAFQRAVLSKPAAHCFATPEDVTENGKMAQIGG